MSLVQRFKAGSLKKEISVFNSQGAKEDFNNKVRRKYFQK